jgi:hypothetical protein
MFFDAYREPDTITMRLRNHYLRMSGMKVLIAAVGVLALLALQLASTAPSGHPIMLAGVVLSDG